ncbi:MAG TPA: tetratricopeptide repeat protein, partial [bacterium]|nr:tetratricopeptide repeat protein [bacterium]
GMDAVKFLNEFSRRKEELNEYPEALSAFAEACDKLPAFAEIHVIHGEMLERVSQMADAAEAYLHAAHAFADRGRVDLSSKLEERAKKAKQSAATARQSEPRKAQAAQPAPAKTMAPEKTTPGAGDLQNLRSLEDQRREAPPPAVPPSGQMPRKTEFEQRSEFRGRSLPDVAKPKPPVRPPMTPRPAISGIHNLKVTRTPSGANWKIFDPAQHPNLPKPPPLPPRQKPVPAAADAHLPEVSRPVEPAYSDEHVSLEPAQRFDPSQFDPAQYEPAANHAPVEPAYSETAGAPPDPAKLREFFDDVPMPVEQAIVIGDDFELVREGGDVLEVINDFRDATREILDLDDHQAHYDLGTTYLEMELFDEAAAEFEIASRGTSFALPSQEMLGYCFLRKGQIHLAVRELEKALTLPGYTELDRLGIYYNLGIACGVTDRESDAIEYFQKILEIDPNFRDTRSRLERLVQNSH